MIRINETAWVNRAHIVEMEITFLSNTTEVTTSQRARQLKIVLSNGALYEIGGLWVGSVLKELTQNEQN